MGFKIHYAPNTRSVRAVWLFEELGLPYELVKYKLGDPAMRTPEYRKIHPMGRVPAVEDGGVTIYESGAIVQYMLTKYGEGRMQPAADSDAFPAYLQWLHYAEGMIMPPINNYVVETVLLPPERRNDEIAMRALKLLNRTLTAVEHHMEGREFLADDFTIADTITGHAVIMARRLGADFFNLPNLSAYADRLEARAAFQAAETA